MNTALSPHTQESHQYRITVLGTHAPAIAEKISTYLAKNIAVEQTRPAASNIAQLEVTAQGSDTSLKQLRTQLETSGLLAGEHSTDVIVTAVGAHPLTGALVVLDVDSTLIQDEVIELLAAHAGREREVAEVTERAMRGEIDFTESLHHRVQTLAGLPESIIPEVQAAVRITPGAVELVHAVNAASGAVGVVSGGFIEIVQPLADSLGISYATANRLEIVNGVLTGRVVGEVIDRKAKERTLKQYASQHGVAMQHTVAIGDGANDLDMLSAAGLGIAFNAKPAVQAAAEVALNVPRLDTVLYLLDRP